MKNVMLDLETMGTTASAAIVSIGAVTFTSDKVLKRFHTGVDLDSCLARGLRVDGGTVRWWLTQPEAARNQLLALRTLPLKEALSAFTAWIGDEEVLMWGNGAAFDNVILRSAYLACRMPTPWTHWNDRCYRTVKRQAPGVKIVRKGTHHNAQDDAESQALHLIEIWKRQSI